MSPSPGCSLISFFWIIKIITILDFSAIFVMMQIRKGEIAMTRMELEAERARLRQQIISLTSITLGPDMAPVRAMAHDSPCRAFLNHLEEQLEEKKARLQELDEQIERATSPAARFRERSRSFLGVLWFISAFMMIVWFLAGTMLDDLSSRALGVCSLLMFLWALWATFSRDP